MLWQVNIIQFYHHFVNEVSSILRHQLPSTEVAVYMTIYFEDIGVHRIQISLIRFLFSVFPHLIQFMHFR